LPPKSAALLIELGIDPKSPQVSGIVNDQRTSETDPAA
jgi:hypothetical protein